jgi:hypothetical protein
VDISCNRSQKTRHPSNGVASSGYNSPYRDLQPDVAAKPLAKISGKRILTRPMWPPTSAEAGIKPNRKRSKTNEQQS